MTQPHGLGDVDALFARSVKDLAGFARVEGKGLFAEDVFPRCDGGEAVALVEAVRGANVDAVNGRVGVELIVTGVEGGLDGC